MRTERVLAKRELLNPINFHPILFTTFTLQIEDLCDRKKNEKLYNAVTNLLLLFVAVVVFARSEKC